jgi:multiple sugar transport system substrate-binding protein
MAKFPDPTRQYKAEPLPAQLDLSQAEESVETTPTESTGETPIASTGATPEPTPPTVEAQDQSPIPPGTPTEASSVEPTPTTSAGATPPHLSPSPFRNLIPLVLGGGIFIILIFVATQLLPRFFNKAPEQVTLTYWGLWEPQSVMQSVIANYEAENPGVKINYSMQSPKNYRARLQAAISQGTPPDIVRIHNTWLPILKDSLSPSADMLNLDDYYPVVSQDLMIAGRVYAIPLMIDGLALYYNEDIFQQAGLTPPTDWNALRKTAFDLTIRNPQTNVIERSGIALGTTNNIEHWSDILGLLILQNSGNPAFPESTSVQDAISFYTTFTTLDQTWDETQPSDVYAFATGTVAMILAPSWQAATIAGINPNLNFKTVQAPTLPETNLAWATYWAEAVIGSSPNQREAWDFLTYLGSPEVLQKLYATQSQLRVIGEIYPLRSLGSLLASDPVAGAYVNQAENYTSWYLSSKTHDEALNDEIIKYYEDAVNSVVQGSPLSSTLSTLSAGVSQILSKYPSITQ